MVRFAKQNVKDYDPDAGNGYYELTAEQGEKISSKTKIILVSDEVCESSLL